VSLYFSPDEASQYKKDNQTVEIESNLGFIRAINGFRRGSLHLVIGTTGGGKSTLVRTILSDFLKNKKNSSFGMGLWLSEESIESYKKQLAVSMTDTEDLKRTEAFSELDLSEDDEPDVFFEWARAVKPELLIFDNVTTSRFYADQTPKHQLGFVSKIKKLAQETNSAVVLIAHTDSKTKDGGGRLIQVEDIRGSRSVSNLVEFAFVMQKVEIGNTIYNMVNISKYRSQSPEERLFQLKYSKEKRAFTGDVPVDFKKFKEIYNARNQL